MFCLQSLRVAVVVNDLKRFKTCLTGGADINESDSVREIS